MHITVDTKLDPGESAYNIVYRGGSAQVQGPNTIEEIHLVALSVSGRPQELYILGEGTFMPSPCHLTFRTKEEAQSYADEQNNLFGLGTTWLEETINKMPVKPGPITITVENASRTPK